MVEIERKCSGCGKKTEIKISFFNYLKHYKFMRTRNYHFFCSQECQDKFELAYNNMVNNLNRMTLQIRKELTEEAIKSYDAEAHKEVIKE